MDVGEIIRRNTTAAFFAVAFVAPVVWMLLDRDPPYVRISGEINPPDPVPGDFVSVEWNIKVNKICQPSEPRNVTRQIITSTGHIIDYEAVEGIFGTDNIPNRGESRELIRTFQLPPAMTPGRATYHSRACFACNPLQTFWPVCVDTPELTFDIRAPK